MAALDTPTRRANSIDAGVHDSGTVDVWLIRTDPPARVVAELAALLDEEERARADRLDPASRHRFVVAHGVVRVIAGRCLGSAPERIRWTRGRYGKPALADPSAGLEVNLSHSGDLAAVAVSRGRPVGVDVQRSLPRLDAAAMSARYFPAVDARFVAEAGTEAERSDRFTRLWARKEACVKAAGGRLVDGLRLPVYRPGDASGRLRAGLLVTDAPVRAGLQVADAPDGPAGPGARFRVRDLPVPPGFRAAVALLGGRPYRVRVRWWSEESDARVA